MWQRGSNNNIMRQCGGCRLPATLKDPTNNKSYTGGYMESVPCLLDPIIGVEYLISGDPRLYLAHHEMVAQGEMIEAAWKSVHGSQEN